MTYRPSLCILFLLLAFPASAAQKQLTLGMTTGSSSPIALAVVAKAYAKLGIEVIGRHMPARHSLEEAQRGNPDGEVSRIAGVEAQYTDLIRSQIPVDHFTVSALAASPDKRIASLDDIRNLGAGVKTGLDITADSV